MDFKHLFEKQTGGVRNIQGIQYQLLYSILRSFELLGDNSRYQNLTLEGIEDLDLKGISFENNFIQVKTSVNEWDWSELRPVLKNFDTILQHNSQNEVLFFFIIFNFSLSPNKPIGQLARFDSLSERDKNIIWNKFKHITSQEGISEVNALIIRERLNIISVNEVEVVTQIKQKLMLYFNIADETLAETYLYRFVGTFLKWSKERKTINANDIKNLHILIQEGYSKQENFEAIGQNLISKIDWKEDLKAQDYFDGKQTRAGHIASNLDIKRIKWLAKIDKEFSIENNVCVILSSSGQGKSTLAFRYMYEYWDKQFLFHLRSATNEREANSIADYLTYLSDLQLPVTLFIDDIKEQTRYFETILQRCSSKRIDILITTRNEDYNRYWKSNTTTFTIVEPNLDLEEAKEIFQNLKKQNPKSIHPTIKFPQIEFEKLGPKPLLIEYMYLITQGQMLHEKLQDQIKDLRNSNRGHLVDILRYITLADSLDITFTIDDLEQLMPYTSDLQGSLTELTQEYIQIENNKLKGLHWVRTKHLADALHQDYNVYKTALKLLEIKPYEITDLIVNTMTFEGVDREAFYSALTKKIKTENLVFLLNILNGLLISDENFYFQENQSIFEEVKEQQPHLIKLLPFSLGAINSDKAKSSIHGLYNSIGSNDIGNKLDTITSKLTQRNFTYTRKFITDLAKVIDFDFCKNNLNSIGELLDWFNEDKILGKKVEILNWEQICHELINTDAIWQLNLNDFSNFTYGLHRYDKKTYFEWLMNTEENMNTYIKKHLEYHTFIIDADGCLKCSYIKSEEGKSLYTLTMEKLKILYSIFPFCETYNVFFDFDFHGLAKPQYDDSYKNIPSSSLFHSLMIFKNSIFISIYEKHFKNNSHFVFQKNWYELRQESLSFVIEIKKYFENKPSFNFKRLKVIDDKLRKLLHSDLEQVQSYDFFVKEEFSKPLKGCFDTYEAFLAMLTKYLNKNEEKDTRHLVQYNFSEFLEKLSNVQAYFSQIPTYADFNFSELTVKENEVYPNFKLLLGYVLNKPVYPNNLMQYLKQK